MRKILYDGPYAVAADGIHTRTQFLRAMKKFKHHCENRKTQPLCASCVELKRNPDNPDTSRYDDLLTQCNKCIKDRLVVCNFDDFMEYSGATWVDVPKRITTWNKLKAYFGAGRKTRRRNVRNNTRCR